MCCLLLKNFINLITLAVKSCSIGSWHLMIRKWSQSYCRITVIVIRRQAGEKDVLQYVEVVLEFTAVVVCESIMIVDGENDEVDDVWFPEVNGELSIKLNSTYTVLVLLLPCTGSLSSQLRFSS